MQTTNSPFSFTIARKGASSNDAPLFSTRGQRLIFKVRVLLTQSWTWRPQWTTALLTHWQCVIQTRTSLHYQMHWHQRKMSRLCVNHCQQASTSSQAGMQAPLELGIGGGPI